MLKKIILIFAVQFFVAMAYGQLQWPTVTATTKPWTRWWWQGSAVNTKDLTWNLEEYKKAGLGGTEITPIYGVYDHENEFVNFLSPAWMQLLQHTLKESKRLGLGVDMANGTGWPFGGPWVADTDASKTIMHKRYTLEGGAQLKELIQYYQDAWVRTANNKPASIDTILKPVSRNHNLQSLALDQIQYPGPLPLKCLMGYNDNQTLDLTNLVDSSGRLLWIAPPSTVPWTLYALFEGLHGKMVERAAPGGEGYAIDHFSATAAKKYFTPFDRAFKGQDLSYLRGFFNDSYEVDDARGQANWTPGLLEKFKSFKGYDLREQLPALFGQGDSELISRVIYDYRTVIDQLILEDFTNQWKAWAVGKGKIIRNQSHGSPANTLDLYSVVDIPETEGTDILRFKFATSAANVSGKKLVSAESATWLDEHFLSSWGDVKKAIDLYFLGGVNHIFYHGTAYSPKNATWPGWLFYAAVQFQPVNPQWKDFHALNQYITRVQSFLQNSRHDNDILLYYPIGDRYSIPGNTLLQHFDGMERNFENTEFEHVAKTLLQNGYSFDFFSERQLKKFVPSGQRILSSGHAYRTILLPANKLITAQAFQKLMQLAKAGAQILIYKSIPTDVPGLSNLADNRKLFNQLKDQLQFAPIGRMLKSTIGKGAFYISDDLHEMLKAVKVIKESYVEKDLSVLRRKNTQGTMYFINNRSEHAFDDWINMGLQSPTLGLFDPMTGKYGLAKTRKNNQGAIEVKIQLQSYESIIIQSYASKKTGAAWSYIDTSAAPQEIKSDWTITFLDGGPELPAEVITSTLGSWTNWSGNATKDFSGTAKYTIHLAKPDGPATTYLLNLGKVHETAEVFLNGQKASTLIGPIFQCIIPTSAFQKTNKLEIIVANLMANRIAYLDRNKMNWKKFYNINMPARRRENSKNGLFDASSWEPKPSGLIGPVTLTPLK